MDRCPDEVLQLILNELSNPGAFVTVNRRIHTLSSDAYVRASYLLARHGRAEALFTALGRGDIVDGRVLEILITAGAPVSRYLAQLAIQHYHNSQVSFIHKPWVRALPFALFVHFLTLVTSHLGENFAPLRKRERDDGEVFLDWSWERWRNAGSDLEKEKRLKVVHLISEWKLQPLCVKDPLAPDFALTLASEPDLLVLAFRNGYRIDPTYRDYVFRQMFHAMNGRNSDSVAQEKRLSTLRELCQLQDSSFFLSRTVAAEVLMECIANVVAYDALSALGNEGQLKFDLLTLKVDLIKSFAVTRSVTDSASTAPICRLFMTLPLDVANDPEVRHVVLVIVFATTSTAAAAHARFLELGCIGLIFDTIDAAHMNPVTPAEIIDVLANPFITTHQSIIAYARFFVQFDQATISTLLEETAVKCLQLSCKGNMLDRLIRKNRSGLRDVVSKALLDQYKLDLDALSASEAAARYAAPLARPVMKALVTERAVSSELGKITQMTLSASVALDVVIPPSSRWRLRSEFKRLDASDSYAESQSMQPQEIPLRLAGWVAKTFGPRSAEAAVLADHAVANWVDPYSYRFDRLKGVRYWWDQEKCERVRIDQRTGPLEDVPLTMKHWRILARLGKEPDATFFDHVVNGKPFYDVAGDYLGNSRSLRPRLESLSSLSSSESVYDKNRQAESKEYRKAKEQALEVEKIKNRDKWVKALGALYREELRAHHERRNQLGLKRATQSKFLVALHSHLYDWRQEARIKRDRERQRLLEEDPSAYIDVYGDMVPDSRDSDDDYDERPAKRRRKD